LNLYPNPLEKWITPIALALKYSAGIGMSFFIPNWEGALSLPFPDDPGGRPSPHKPPSQETRTIPQGQIARLYGTFSRHNRMEFFGTKKRHPYPSHLSSGQEEYVHGSILRG
jgi:hypothetical protein